MEAWSVLFSGGRYALPYLIKFSCPGLTSLYFANNNEDIVYSGQTFKACSFEYTEPDANGNGAALHITGIGTQVFEFVENADSRYRLEVVGTIAGDGTILPVKLYTHCYGTVSMDSEQNLDFQLSRDDRLDMVFTPYTYDTENNKGNS